MDGLEERIDRKELARQRARKWRLDNPERAKANAVRTYVNNKEHYKKYRKQWAKDNAGRVRELRHANYLANRDKRIAASVAWTKRNRQRYLDNQSAWRKRESERRCINAKERLAIQRKALPRWADKQQIAEKYRTARKLSHKTGVKHHVDHIVPMISPLVCGLHVENNLQVVPAAYNVSKKNLYWPDMP